MIDMSSRSEMSRNETQFNFFLESNLNEIFQRSKESLTKLSEKSVLVTGAAGFLGRYFIATFQMYKNKFNPIKFVAIDSHITSTDQKVRGLNPCGRTRVYPNKKRRTLDFKAK